MLHYKSKIAVIFILLITQKTLKPYTNNILIQNTIKTILTNEKLLQYSCIELSQDLQTSLPFPTIAITQTILNMFNIFYEHYSLNETTLIEQTYVPFFPKSSCTSTISAIVNKNDIQIHDFHNNQSIFINNPFDSNIDIISIAPDNSLIIAGGVKEEQNMSNPFLIRRNKLLIWQLYKQNKASPLEAIPLTSLNNNATILAFSNDSKLLAIGTRHGTIYIYNALTWQTIHRFNSYNNKTITSLAFSHDNQNLASANIENFVTIHSLNASDKKIYLYCNKNLPAQCLKFSEQKDLLIFYSEDEKIYSQKWIPSNKEILHDLSLAQLILSLKIYKGHKLKYEDDKGIYKLLPPHHLAALNI